MTSPDSVTSASWFSSETSTWDTPSIPSKADFTWLTQCPQDIPDTLSFLFMTPRSASFPHPTMTQSSTLGDGYPTLAPELLDPRRVSALPVDEFGLLVFVNVVGLGLRPGLASGVTSTGDGTDDSPKAKATSRPTPPA